jgi:hypothetical protein
MCPGRWLQTFRRNPLRSSFEKLAIVYVTPRRHIREDCSLILTAVIRYNFVSLVGVCLNVGSPVMKAALCRRQKRTSVTSEETDVVKGSMG